MPALLPIVLPRPRMPVDRSRVAPITPPTRSDSYAFRDLIQATEQLVTWETQAGFYPILYVSSSSPVLTTVLPVRPHSQAASAHARPRLPLTCATTLQDVVSNRELRADARLIAVLFFKNRIDRYWRKNVTGYVLSSKAKPPTAPATPNQLHAMHGRMVRCCHTFGAGVHAAISHHMVVVDPLPHPHHHHHHHHHTPPSHTTTVAPVVCLS